jgi:6-phosphogluconolactonase
MELVVYETEAAVAVGSAGRIAELLGASSDRFTLGLAGGSTPAATYAALRGRATGWHRVEAWLSDERWVPPHHELSNGRMAAETLMDHVSARFVRPRWSEFLEPEDSAAHYEATLRSLHREQRPDLILLGMGEDAHTASLFPGSKTLEETQRWFVATEIPESGEPRLTAAYPLLWGARRLMVITAGGHKAAALREALQGKTPVGRIAEGDAEVEWHVDRAAAALLS